MPRTARVRRRRDPITVRQVGWIAARSADRGTATTGKPPGEHARPATEGEPTCAPPPHQTPPAHPPESPSEVLGTSTGPSADLGGPGRRSRRARAVAPDRGRRCLELDLPERGHAGNNRLRQTPALPPAPGPGPLGLRRRRSDQHGAADAGHGVPAARYGVAVKTSIWANRRSSMAATVRSADARVAGVPAAWGGNSGDARVRAAYGGRHGAATVRPNGCLHGHAVPGGGDTVTCISGTVLV